LGVLHSFIGNKTLIKTHISQNTYRSDLGADDNVEAGKTTDAILIAPDKCHCVLIPVEKAVHLTTWRGLARKNPVGIIH